MEVGKHDVMYFQRQWGGNVMKVKKVIGMNISVLIITYMIVVLIKTNLVAVEYPSATTKAVTNLLTI